MGTYTINSWCYYSVSTVTATGDQFWSRQALSGSNPGYTPASYTEGAAVDNNLSPGETLDPDYSALDATYVGTVTYNGREFLVFEDEFGQLLGSSEAGVAHADFPPAVDFDGNYTAGDSSDDIASTVTPICFLTGTQIQSPKGQIAVECLKAGDMVLIADGGEAEVKWIGRQTVSTRFGPAERLMPVRFAAGSLGEGLPHTDLTVTADHGMLVSGVICHAGALVNGTTITRVPLSEMGERYTVYHIETEEHEIILANGAPAETFIDNVSRRVFDNFTEFEALYGDVPEMEELPYPRAMSARQVPAHIRAALTHSRVA
ncbi:Hint domain-containing protein [Nioella ostreopsis]|uniref:Hint domain-containing protein n=1 Tax=Nioella ostreopsis TaxID=2448479 RepID=UPI000FD955FF|nr:Hint domain-containing protein [Nioella ostreopsis]